jgi:hypothetical protein
MSDPIIHIAEELVLSAEEEVAYLVEGEIIRHAPYSRE